MKCIWILYRVGQLAQWILPGPTLLEPKVKDTNYYVQYFPGVDFCIPSSCSPDDLRRAISEFGGQKAIISGVDEFNETYYYSIAVYAGDDWCYTRESVDATPNFDGPDIAVM